MEEKILDLLLKNAKKAFDLGEIPVSALIVRNGKILSCYYNSREKYKDVMAHAEILAIKKAAKKLKRWNLNDCILYSSLKPCSMCEEIIKQCKIEKVVYFLEKPDFKKEFSKTKYYFIPTEEFSLSYQQLLSDFFQNKR